MNLNEALKYATDTKACLIGDGVLAQVPAVFREQFPGRTSAIVIADPRTWKAAGEQVTALLQEAGVKTTKYIVEPGGKTFHAEYHYVCDVRTAIEQSNNRTIEHSNIRTFLPVPVAVGSGVINDLTKRAAGELGIPYMVCATAASVDGYSSFGAALVSPEGAKQTYPCPAPRAIVADLDVMRTAPKEMASYGFADLLAKCPAGVDWILAAELGATEWHDVAWHIVQDGIPEAIRDAEGVARGETGPMTRFVEGLMLSGIAMQAMQSSRPASGAEHMFSHILDMTHHTFRGELVSHGAQVGVYTLFMTRFHEALLKLDMASLDVEKCVAQWSEWDQGGEALARAPFAGTKFPDLGVEQSKPKWQTKEELRATLEAAKVRWPEIAARLRRQLVPSVEIEKKLKAVGSPSCPAEIGAANGFAQENVRFAMFMRNRYNALDFAFRLGQLDALAAEAASAWV